jgi:molecular chaperone DnaK
MAKTIAIDLGTTDSCMSVLEGDWPTVILNSEGERTTPSVVAFTRDGKRLVGSAARRQAVTNPTNTVFSVKRFIGRKKAEVREEESIVPYNVVSGPRGDVRVEANGRLYSPPEISAILLQKLRPTPRRTWAKPWMPRSSPFRRTSMRISGRRPRTPAGSPA